MRSTFRLVLFFTLLLATSGVFAAEPAASAAQPGPKKEAFEKIFVQWKGLLTELASLSQKHVTATTEEKRAIEKQYNDLIAQGELLQPKIELAAEEAYAEAPDADPQLTQFLLASCHGYFQMDDYERSFRLAKLLLDNGAKEDRLYLWGAISAFCIGDLDTALAYMKKADEKGVEFKTDKGETLDNTAMVFFDDPRKHTEDWKKERAIRAAEAKADDLPRVLLKTSEGDIEIELFENEAPNTVANFISLVEKGFYDGLTFHRVLEGFMAQGGCPDGTGGGGPGYEIPCECYKPNYRKHFRGTLSMAHAGRDTGGSQFFITFIPTSFLDGRHTAFGRVIKGMDVVSKIRKRDPSDEKATLPAPGKIIEAKVLRKRDHEYVPKKTGE